MNTVQVSVGDDSITTDTCTGYRYSTVLYRYCKLTVQVQVQWDTCTLTRPVLWFLIEFN